MSISQEINNIIRDKSYISVDEFMQIAMSSMESSYYRSKEPLGESGDFVTSPEISQMFGEMIAIWCIDSWHKLGRPSKCNLLEYGAGNGSLMRDLLRMSKMDQAFYDSLDIWIIDINPKLKEIQKDVLKQFQDKDVKWVSAIDDVSKYPTIIIANEFFDALPIKQYEKRGNNWKEKILVIPSSQINRAEVISRDLTFSPIKYRLQPFDVKIPSEQFNLGSGILDINKRGLQFALRTIDSTLDRELYIEHPNALEGAVCEKSSDSIKIIKEITQHISANKGAALIIDYGYYIDPASRVSSQYLSTIQAVKNHKYLPVLKEIGEADISAHVDFWELKKAAGTYAVEVFGAISQSELLSNCGIDIRLKSLVNSNPNLSQILENQYHRLMDKDKMGELFKAIVIMRL